MQSRSKLPKDASQKQHGKRKDREIKRDQEGKYDDGSATQAVRIAAAKACQIIFLHRHGFSKYMYSPKRWP